MIESDKLTGDAVTKKRAVGALALAMLLTGCEISPKTLTMDDLVTNANANLKAVTADQEPVERPLSLYEAMARAIKYNLDYKVGMMEQALRSRELKQAEFDLLPQIVANAGYTKRSNFSGASSSRIIDDRTIGEQSLVASTSSERKVSTRDISVSWNLLDFGLSYIRAKQKGDEVLIAEEQRRKVVIRIVEDVRTAYWRTVSAERLIEDLSLLEEDIQSALDASRKSYARRKTPPMTALTYQRELIRLQEELQDLRQELGVSKHQLASLMNFEPGKHFDVVMPDRYAPDATIRGGPEEMVMAALVNRPELREVAYRQRINEDEAHAALLDLLPSLRVYGGFNYDSNDFLFNNHWAGWGARASWNLIEAFRYPTRRQTVKAQQDVLNQRALALSMAVITQVHVSRARYELAKRKVDTMRLYHEVQSDILNHVQSGYAARRISHQTQIRERMSQLVVNAKFDIALAEQQNAFANVFAAIGIDPYPQGITGDEPIADLADALETHWRELTRSLSAEKTAS